MLLVWVEGSELEREIIYKFKKGHNSKTEEIIDCFPGGNMIGFIICTLIRQK